MFINQYITNMFSYDNYYGGIDQIGITEILLTTCKKLDTEIFSPQCSQRVLPTL